MITSSNGNISTWLAFCEDSPYKGQWRGALMFSFDLRLKKCWANNRDVVDLRRHPSHYDVTVLCIFQFKRDRWKHGWMNGPIVGWVGEWLDVIMDGWMGRDRDTLYKSQIMDDSSSADIQINSAQVLHAVIFSMPWRVQMETFSASLALCAGN